MYARRGESMEALQKEKEKLESIAGTFGMVKNSNVLAYAKVVVRERTAYLIRQFFAHNLYERLGTRPFLTTMEKKWILFQLLMALDQCHHWGISHGDITAENVLLTSWHWAYLADFGPFKPAYLPLEDPSDFTFFYNSSGRTAYIAPERFYSLSDTNRPELISCAHLPPTADIFSFGCVAAELFLDEKPLFDFAQLLAFRKGQYDVDSVINQIEDDRIKELVRRCVQLDPAKRISVSDMLRDWSEPSFKHIHRYLSERLLAAEPDKRIARLAKDFDLVLKLVMDPSLAYPETWPSAALKKDRAANLEHMVDSPLRRSVKTLIVEDTSIPKDVQPHSSIGVLAAAHELLEPLKNGSNNSSNNNNNNNDVSFEQNNVMQPNVPQQDLTLLKKVDDVSSDTFDGTPSPPLDNTPTAPAMVTLLSVVCASIRNVRTPASKIEALKLLVRFAHVVDDEARLQRIIPYILSVLPHSDDKPLVRACVIRSLTRVLELVHVGEAASLQSYILPSISQFSKDVDETVRESLASCLSSLASSSRRLTETVQSDKGFDGILHDLRKSFHGMVRDLLEDNSMAVKRRILMSLTPLCLFFGRRISTETFVPFLITFLSHNQWQLRLAAYHHLLGVMSIVGSKSLEDITLALISKSFGDPEEFVIEKALSCVISLVKAGLLRKKIVFDMVSLAAPLLLHPSKWIGSAALLLQQVVWNSLSVADRHVFICPMLNPFLTSAILPTAQAQVIVETLKMPVSRQELIVALAVAHELFRKNQRTDTQGYSAHLLARLKQNKVADASLGRLLLLAPWMQAHAESNMAKVMEAEAEAAAAAESAVVEREGTIERPLRLPNVNVVTIEDSEKKHSGSRLSDEEWNRKFSHVAMEGGASHDEGLSASGSHSNLAGSSHNVTLNQSASEILDETPSGALPDVLLGGGAASASAAAGGGAGKSANYASWRPKGTLVAHLHEHTASVTQMAVSDDNRFFVSGSLDGTVKVWDCERLHSIVTNRSRLTCKMSKGEVNSVAILRNTHCVASACSMGTVNVFNVEHQRRAEKNYFVTKYTGIQSVRFIDKGEGSVFDVRHFDKAPSSVLMYATSRGIIHGWDLRLKDTSKDAFMLKNSPQLGLLTCITVDSSNNWIVTGSDLGVYTIWDLRFQVPVKSFRHPLNASVLSLQAAQSAKLKNCVFSSNADNTVTLWDIEGNSCKHLFRMSRPKEGPPDPLPPIENLEGLMRPTVVGDTQVKRLPSVPGLSAALSTSSAELTGSVLFPIGPGPGTTRKSADNMRTVDSMSDLSNVAADLPWERPSVRSLLNPLESPYLLTGSTDCRIRYWDLAKPADSYTVCGLSKNHMPVYTSDVHETVTVSQESVMTIANRNNGARSVATAGLAVAATGHKDCITDLQMMSSIAPMLLSADRSGVIKVWL